MRFGVLPLLAALAVPFTTACADNESSLYIRQVVAPADDCTYDPDPGGRFFSRGFLDAGLRLEYVAHLLVGNQIVARGDPDSLRTETSKITLYEYDVEIFDSEGDSVQSYTAPASGFVDEDREGIDPYGLTSAVLIDAETAQKFGGLSAQQNTFQELVAAVKIRGRTLGGNEIESAVFQFPISICSNCSIFFPSEADDPASPGLCDAVEVDLETVCTPGQDTVTPCIQCRDSPTPSADDACNPG